MQKTNKECDFKAEMPAHNTSAQLEQSPNVSSSGNKIQASRSETEKLGFTKTARVLISL